MVFFTKKSRFFNFQGNEDSVINYSSYSWFFFPLGVEVLVRYQHAFCCCFISRNGRVIRTLFVDLLFTFFLLE
jgi:hypothetical protein